MLPQCPARPGTLSLRTEGWQSGRMRRSRKPFRAVSSDEGSNPSPSAEPPRREERCPSGLRSATGNRVRGESSVAGSNPALSAEGPPTAGLSAALELAGMTDEEFVERAYRLVLRRAPDDLDATAARLRGTLSRATLLHEL